MFQVMRTTVGMAFVTMALASCGGAAAQHPGGTAPDCGAAATGSIVDLTTATGPGTRFSVPQMLETGDHGDSGGYIEVAGAAGGARTIAFGREHCMELPDPTSAACPTIEAGTLAKEVWRRLEAQGVKDLNGIGLGVGGDLKNSDTSAWHFGLGVTHWPDADAALAATAAVLDEYGVATAMGVSVRGVSCAVLEGT